MNTEVVYAALEKCINAIYRESLDRPDIPTMKVLEGLINVLTRNSIPFTEIISNGRVKLIELSEDLDVPYPADSYFIKLASTIFNMNKKSNDVTPARPRIHAPIAIKKSSDIKPTTPPTDNLVIKKDKYVKPRLSMFGCTDLSTISAERIAQTPPDILNIYKECGCKEFLKGEKLLHKVFNVIGIVKSFSINGANVLTFGVTTEKIELTQWSISNCLIYDSETDTHIPVTEYIRDNKIDVTIKEQTNDNPRVSLSKLIKKYE